MAYNKAGEREDGQVAALPEDWVFALDIGTRSVIGIVGQRRGDVFEMADMEVREHPSRAMVDGQIENIEQVAQVAKQVKESLESRLGMELRYVNVAAAGRALKTGRGEFALDVGTGKPITSQQMYELEVGAIAQAREQVQKTQQIAGRFYCVGHSVVRYHLDDYPFSTILGHKGDVAKAEVIATFLPTEVVDSLISAMSKIGCEISHMTLEPIAAMNAVIPPDLRLLNLALVDIGAGTSDIAISEDGTVSAYTMATVAGDEITEELIKKYLVDFHTAERMKHEAAQGCAEIVYRDILGFDYTVSLEETLETLQPAVESLSEEICRRIVEVNGKAPAAVFLVGGGSLTPGLCQCVAKHLGLDQRRVAIGGENYIKRVTGASAGVSGPAFATPIGIALTASTVGTGKGFFVTVNEEKVRLFRNDRMSIMDVLLSSGYQYKDVMGQSGKPITYHVNGEKRIKRGGHLTPAQLFLNGKEASISTPVNCEDEIRFIPAQSGRDAALTLTDIGLDPQLMTVYFGATPVQAGRFVTINGQAAESGQAIHDFDAVAYTEAMTLRELCLQIGIEWRENTFLLGDVFAPGDTLLKEGDVICYTQGYAVSDLAQKATESASASTVEASVEDVPSAPVQKSPVPVVSGAGISKPAVSLPASTVETSVVDVPSAPVQKSPVPVVSGAGTSKPAVSLPASTVETSVEDMPSAPVQKSPVPVVSGAGTSKPAVSLPASTVETSVADVPSASVQKSSIPVVSGAETSKPAVPLPASTVETSVADVPSASVQKSSIPVVSGAETSKPAVPLPASTVETSVADVPSASVQKSSIPVVSGAETSKPAVPLPALTAEMSAGDDVLAQPVEKPPIPVVGITMPMEDSGAQAGDAAGSLSALMASLQEEQVVPVEDGGAAEGNPPLPELPPPPPGRRRAAPGEALRILLNGETRLVPPKLEKHDYHQFVDMLALVDIDPANPQGKIILRLNGKEPSYLDELFMDDVVEIYWAKD